MVCYKQPPHRHKSRKTGGFPILIWKGMLNEKLYCMFMSILLVLTTSCSANKDTFKIQNSSYEENQSIDIPLLENSQNIAQNADNIYLYPAFSMWVSNNNRYNTDTDSESYMQETPLEPNPVFLENGYILTRYPYCDVYQQPALSEVTPFTIYQIYNKNNEIIFEDYTGYNGVNYEKNGDIIALSIPVGTGSIEYRSYNYLNDSLSEKYSDVVLVEENLIVYGVVKADEVYLVVHDIFNKQNNYNQIILENYPRNASFITPVKHVEIKNSVVTFTYLSSESDETIDGAEERSEIVSMNLQNN